MTAASAKERAIELLWIVGAAAVALIVVSVSLRFSSEVLSIEIDELFETAVAVLAAVGGGAWGVQTYRKKAD
jgi:uncharacterized Zn finger protein